jgi:hypothetical protein
VFVVVKFVFEMAVALGAITYLIFNAGPANQKRKWLNK